MFVDELLCNLMVDIDLNTTAAEQKYTFLAQLLSFINIQDMENLLILTHNQWKYQKQSF